MAIKGNDELLKFSKPSIATVDEYIDLTTLDYDNNGGDTPFYVEATEDCTVKLQLLGSISPTTRYFRAGECKPILVRKVFRNGTTITDSATSLIAQI